MKDADVSITTSLCAAVGMLTLFVVLVLVPAILILDGLAGYESELERAIEAAARELATPGGGK